MTTNAIEKDLTLVKGLRFGNKSVKIYLKNNDEYFVVKKYYFLYLNIRNKISRHFSLEDAQDELNDFMHQEISYLNK